MMASQQGFSFPPPPPPPPSSTQQQFPQAGSHSTQNVYNYRGGSGRGGPGGGFRGRGRGGMNRGGRGGASHPNYRNNNQQGMYNGGYTMPSNAPKYYQNNSQYGSLAQTFQPVTQGFAAQTHVAPTYPPTNYDGRFQNTQNGSTAPIPSYTGNIQSHSTASVEASVVAPPMHWGYDRTGAGGFYPGSTTYQNPVSHAHPQGNNYQNQHGHKRRYSSTFEKPISQGPRPTAPPAVPSFGVPLPAKPPLPAETSRQAQKKKKRKFNQLGLTPKTEEHESSDEDDADEESRLASAAGNLAGPLQFTFRGRTSTLNNATDIQLWIEERKKRFPTQARIEEKKKAQEEAKKQKELQREEARHKQQELREQREQARKEAQEKKDMGSDPMDAALKAKAKAEKLRKKLLKEERRLQKAEADAERARLVAEASQQHLLTDDIPPMIEATVQGNTMDENQSIVSESVSSENEDSDDDVPEEMSSRRQGPERVPPPPREGQPKPRKPCRDFQRRGKCPRGSHCRYSHDLSTEGTDKSRPTVKPGAGAKQPAKRGLFQMLVEQEIQARDRQVMQAISWLGSQGLLEEHEPATNGSTGDDTLSASDTVVPETHPASV